MPVISGTTTQTSAGTTPNVLEGSSFEFLEQNSVVKFRAITVNPDVYTTQCLFQIGGITVMQPDFALIFPASAADSDIIPNDMYHNYIERAAPAGARLFLTFTVAANVRVNWLVRIDGM